MIHGVSSLLSEMDPDKHRPSDAAVNKSMTINTKNSSMLTPGAPTVAPSAALPHHHMYTVNSDGFADHEKLHEAHEQYHKEHAGHENQHAVMLIIIITCLIASQIGLIYWKKAHFRSYQFASFVGLLTVPVCVSLSFGYWRFVAVWLIFCIITTWVGRRAFQRHISGSTPRIVYSYFYFLHVASASMCVGGYFLFLLTLLGITSIFFNDVEPLLNNSLLLMFYGLYYGVLGRDLADICTDRMASHIGYYSKEGLPRLKLGANVCAACGNQVPYTQEALESIRLPETTDDGQAATAWALSEKDVAALSAPPAGYAADESGALIANDHYYSHADNSADPYEQQNPWPPRSAAGDATHRERVVILSCRHVFHEFCLRGWCIVGKKETCPYCKERVNISKVFPNPWEKPHVLFGRMIDVIRYFVVWQPLVFAIGKAVIHFAGLN